MMNGKRFTFLLIIMIVGLLTISSASYATTFYLTPGTNPGANVDGDLAFQASVTGMTFVEEDFDGFSNNDPVGPLVYDDVTVGLSVNQGRNPVAFNGWWNAGAGVAGGIYGTVYGRALDVDVFDPNPNFYKFSFSGTDVVKGFGIWIFDDSSDRENSFSMTVESLDGTLYTSNPLLDANPGSMNHAIEGFIGAQCLSGIKSVTINNANGGSFELDHMQIASTSQVPIPGAMWLLGSGLLGLLGIRRKKA